MTITPADLKTRNEHLLSLEPAEQRLRLSKLLKAKLEYAAAVHGLSPSELVEHVLTEALAFDLPAVPFVEFQRVSLHQPLLRRESA